MCLKPERLSLRFSCEFPLANKQMSGSLVELMGFLSFELIVVAHFLLVAVFFQNLHFAGAFGEKLPSLNQLLLAFVHSLLLGENLPPG